jgi:exopolyphosphatase/guanosine-5'-triphosphate,3'-diphosphate pyrophosphatase
VRQTAPIQAAIDLGTNTVLMVTGRRADDGAVDILDDAHEIARMGKGVDEARRILPKTVDRVCAFLDGYRQRAEALGAGRIRAFGTSALRDAANKTEFIDEVRRQAGIELCELSGDEEARFTFAGAAFGLDLPPRYAVLDIGGGSTELAVGQAGSVEQSQSVDVGAVRVTERHFPVLPPDTGQRRAASAMIEELLADLFDLPPETPLVGVAGTVTTLGALDAGAPSFDATEIDGHLLSTAAAAALSDRLLALRHEEICALPQVSDQRADIIGAGSLILRTFLESRGLPGVTVSTRGIRYGLLLAMLDGTL